MASAWVLVVIVVGSVGYFYDSGLGGGSQPSPVNSSSVSFGSTIENLTTTQGHTRSIAINPVTEMLYYGYDGSNMVTAYNLTARHVVANIRVDLANTSFFPQIMGIAVNPMTDMIYVVDSGGLTVISGRNNSIVATVALDGFPSAVAVNPVRDMVYASTSSGLSIVDGNTNRLAARLLSVKGANAIAVDTVANAVYAVNNTNVIVKNVATSYGTLWKISGSNNSVIASYPIGAEPGGLAVNTVARLLYVPDRVDVNASGGYAGGISIFDLAAGKVVSNVIFQPASGDTGAVATDPVTGLVYVASCNYGVQILNSTANTTPVLARSSGCPSDVVVDPSSHIAYATELLGTTIISATP